MKYFAIAILTVSLSGCLVETLTTTAIQGELAAQNAAAATQVLDHAKQNVGQISANQNAAMQQAAGTAPASGMTQADIANKEKIRQAINKYGQAVGYYPPSLQALVQYGYMTVVPKTSSGQDFVFYTENGGLFHPAELAMQSQPGRGGAGAGGAGLMGETMTGIGVQQQLNGMNQGGVSNVGSYARQGVRGKSENYSDKQMQTMKDLDLDK